VFGAGPALGRAVALRYAREGYAVVLVARRRAPLEQTAADLAGMGTTAHAITADLSDIETIPSSQILRPPPNQTEQLFLHGPTKRKD